MLKSKTRLNLKCWEDTIENRRTSPPGMIEELSDGAGDPLEPGLEHSMLPGHLWGSGSWGLLDS